MPQLNGDGRNSDPENSVPTNRRTFLSLVSGATVTALAGCQDSGGDTDTEPGGTPEQTMTPGDTPDTASPGDTSTETGSPTETNTSTDTIEVLDRTMRVFESGTLPSKSQFQFHNLKNYVGLDKWLMKYAHTTFDGKIYSGLMEDITYQPGVVTLKMHDDFYWWNGTNVTAEDARVQYHVNNYVNYPTANEKIVRFEKMGDYEFRLFLDDTYRENYALNSTVVGSRLWGNRDYYRSYLEDFEDMTTESEINKLADRLSNKITESDPEPMFNINFKLEATEPDRYILKRRDDVHFSDVINYDTYELVISEEADKKGQQAFLSGNSVPLVGESKSKLEPSFDAEEVSTPAASGPGAYQFNCGKAPTSDPHFRRAFAHILNRKKHATTTMNVDEYMTGVPIKDIEVDTFGQSFLDSLTGYGLDSVNRDAAQAEMEAGGYEQDSDGNWLFKEGDRAGEPMKFTVPYFPFIADLANNATSFVNEMADFGIQLDLESRDTGALWEDLSVGPNFEIALAYWGGGPQLTDTYSRSFLDTGPTGAHGINNFPETVELPPVGDSDGSDETYEVANMVSLLAVTSDQDKYDALAKRLAWICNQGLPGVTIGLSPSIDTLNTQDWEWLLPKPDHPAWSGKIFQNGVIKAKE